MPPIFFIGVPRSGTTVIFESFANHPDLAWISNYSKHFPVFPCLNVLRPMLDNRWVQLRGKKNQFGELSMLNDLIPRPDEAYPFWDYYGCKDFARSYLLQQSASDQERRKLQHALEKTRKYQRRLAIAAKFTGPGRIAYLSSVFDDCIFVHIIRDGMSVVRSLLNVDFWGKGSGLTEPWWSGGLSESDLDGWTTQGSNADYLAALQWRRIIETTRSEASHIHSGHYHEVRYEDFVEDPNAVISDLYLKVGLRNSVFDDQLSRTVVRNNRYAADHFTTKHEDLITVMQPVYSQLGYHA